MTAIKHTLQDALQYGYAQAAEALQLAQSMSWQEIKDAYVCLVTEYIPGPLSLSYFVPCILLPVALMIPPSILSQKQLCAYFLPPIYAGVFHAWYAMGGVDVISVDGLLWCTLFIAFRDVRKDFRRLVRTEEASAASRQTARGDEKMNGNLDKTALEDEPDEVKNGYQSSVVSSKDDLETDEERTVAQPYPESFLPRLKWVFTLIASTRLHGWLTASPLRDQRQMRNFGRSQSRKAYVASVLPALIFTECLLLPLVHQLAVHDPAVRSLRPLKQSASWSHPLTGDVEPTPQTVLFLQEHGPTLILRPLTAGLYAFCILAGGYYFGVPLVVFSNWLIGLPPDTWSIHTLPDHFGPFSSVLDHGVGALWGRWWHQHMRVMASGPGLAVADYLGLDEKSLIAIKDAKRRALRFDCRYTLQVVSGFFFSGVTHMGLVPPLVPGAMGLRLRVASFFWVQAIAVLGERLVSDLIFGRASPKRSEVNENSRSIVGKYFSRGMRLSWVLAWLSLTLPLLGRPMDQLGWWKLWPPPGMPDTLRYYMRGEWIP